MSVDFAITQELQKLIRQHTSIENQYHWVLDVTFDEDQSRTRKGRATTNLAMLRAVTLSLLKQDGTIKHGIKGKRYWVAPHNIFMSSSKK